MGAAYLTDPVLRVIDRQQMPSAFIALPDEEQRWRGRLYLARLWGTHHEPFAWIAALDPDLAIEAEWRATIEGAPDEHYLEYRRAMLAEMALELGRGDR